MNNSNSSPNLIQIIRKSLIVYLIAAAAVLSICFIFGWRSIENIGTGFIYGSLGLALFGALTLAGNTVPAQLSKLSIPKYIVPSRRPQQAVNGDDSQLRNEGVSFFVISLISGAFLLLTGLLIKMLR